MVLVNEVKSANEIVEKANNAIKFINSLSAKLFTSENRTEEIDNTIKVLDAFSAKLSTHKDSIKRVLDIYGNRIDIPVGMTVVEYSNYDMDVLKGKTENDLYADLYGKVQKSKRQANIALAYNESIKPFMQKTYKYSKRE